MKFSVRVKMTSEAQGMDMHGWLLLCSGALQDAYRAELADNVEICDTTAPVFPCFPTAPINIECLAREEAIFSNGDEDESNF